MYQKSAAFKAPTKLDQKIWRYMTYNKYKSLLQTEALYFSALKYFKDPFEGIYPKRSRRAFEKAYYSKVERRRNKEESPSQFLKNFQTMLNKCYFVNCWHMNDHESAAMWNLYSKDQKGIAVVSTYTKLKGSLRSSREPVCIGVVKYIDYSKDIIPANYVFDAILHKRMSFDHERELRAVYAKMENFTKIDEEGHLIAVDIKKLVGKIYVHPDSSDRFYKKVCDITRKKLPVRVIKSTLYDLP